MGRPELTVCVLCPLLFAPRDASVTTLVRYAACRRGPTTFTRELPPMSTVLDDVLILSDRRRLGYRVRGDQSAVPILHFHGQPGSRFEADIYPDDVLEAAGAKVVCY